MASKILRATQSIFGSSAGTNQMAEFGSLAAGSPHTYSGSTITPSIVQTLSNYLTGWFGAIVGSNSPAIEDMNALFFLVTYQLAYLLEMGMAEYDSATIYFQNSQVQYGGITYTCINDNSGAGISGQVPTNSAYWAQPIQNSLVVPNAIAVNTSTQANTNSLLPGPTTVNTGETLTVASGSYLSIFRKLTLSGTAVLQVNGTGIVTIF